MTRLIATVTNVLRPGIHKIGSIQDGELRAVADLPLASHIEIDMKGGPEDPCFLYRYTAAGEFSGDTWHLNLADAIDQASWEYGLTEEDFSPVDEQSAGVEMPGPRPAGQSHHRGAEDTENG